MHAYVTSEEFLGTKLSSNLICAGSQGSIMCIKNPYLSCMHIFWSTRLGFSWQGSRKSWGRPCSIADLIMTAAKAQAILRQNVEPGCAKKYRARTTQTQTQTHSVCCLPGVPPAAPPVTWATSHKKGSQDITSSRLVLGYSTTLDFMHTQSEIRTTCIFCGAQVWVLMATIRWGLEAAMSSAQKSRELQCRSQAIMPRPYGSSQVVHKNSWELKG
jgi:hypothetical protein